MRFKMTAIFRFFSLGRSNHKIRAILSLYRKHKAVPEVSDTYRTKSPAADHLHLIILKELHKMECTKHRFLCISQRRLLLNIDKKDAVLRKKRSHLEKIARTLS